MTSQLQNELQDNSLQVLTVAYVATTLLFSLFRSLHDVDLGTTDTLDTDIQQVILSNVNVPFLVVKNWIFCAAKFKESSDRGPLFVAAISTLLQRQSPELSQEDVVGTAKKIVSACNWESDIIWEQAFSRSTYFHTDEVIWPPSGEDLQQFGFIHSKGKFSEEEEESDDFISSVAFGKRSEDEAFAQRVKEISPDHSRMRKPGSTPTVVSDSVVQETKKCGVYLKISLLLAYLQSTAEHFFCKYLKLQYGDAFNEFRQWRSSGRLAVYPNATQSITTLFSAH